MPRKLTNRSLSLARSLAKYVRRFGPRRGLRNILQTSRRRRAAASEDLIGVNLSERSAELAWLRAGTSDVTVFEQVFVDCEYDINSFPQARALRASYARMIADGRTPVILDCGANIGMAALWFKRQFPAATVVAIEPSPANYRILLRNLAGAPGAIAIPAAIWNLATQVRIVDETAEPWGFQVEPCDDERCAIPTVTISQALQRVACGALLIVKIDIEGSEETLFADETEWLSEVPLLIIELHDWMLPWRRTSRNFLRAMSKLDYDMVQKGENLFWFRAPPELAQQSLAPQRHHTMNSQMMPIQAAIETIKSPQ
jgi:FkbM family methyltransferase